MSKIERSRTCVIFFDLDFERNHDIKLNNWRSYLTTLSQRRINKVVVFQFFVLKDFNILNIRRFK